MILDRIKKIGIVVVLCAIVASAGLYFYHGVEKGPIYDFNPVTDTQPIVNLFEQNWYWLVANEGFSPSFVLKHRTPNENPRYFGKMKIKVLKEDNKVAGFVTYYQEHPHDFHLLFLAVGHEFRGKHYAHTLVQYAIDDMIKMGAQRMWLLTRVSNVAAQKVYKNLGFTEFYHDPAGYIYFEKFV